MFFAIDRVRIGYLCFIKKRNKKKKTEMPSYHGKSESRISVLYKWSRDTLELFLSKWVRILQSLRS